MTLTADVAATKACRDRHAATGVDLSAYNTKENAADIPEQVCITKDNVQVHVDGVLYLKKNRTNQITPDNTRASPLRA